MTIQGFCCSYCTPCNPPDWKTASNKKNSRALILLTTSLLLISCASSEEEILTEREYYSQARQALKDGNFSEATAQLEALETYHPFGRYAEQAQLDLIFARYNALDTEGALAAAERFIRLNPDSPHVDYAWYIRGLASYYADVGMAARFLPITRSSRDIGQAREAFQSFSTLVRLYPDSPYAADAEQRMVAIRNHMAEYEMHVATYYIRREAYLAAANRARYVVENYPETPAVADALAMMVELYRQLSLDVQAADALTILAANYPDHQSLDAELNFVGGMVKRENRGLDALFDLGWD